MARKKIPMQPQPPQVKPSADGTGQVTAQPQVTPQPAQPQAIRPQAQQPNQAQPAQVVKPQPPQSSQPQSLQK